MHYYSSLIIYPLLIYFHYYHHVIINAARFDITNNCPYTVWAAAIPGGGRRLNQGMAWQLDVPSSVPGSRVWGRTNCQFDGSGKGSCQTGDCQGLLQCESFGKPPVTLAEFSLDVFDGLDFYDVSMVDGFNVPMEFRPTSGISSCEGVKCSTDITRQCPNVLRAPGGCNNPCAVFKTDQYCCYQLQGPPSGCGPTDYSRFFKDRCPNAYSYPLDDNTATFSCLTGTNYTLVFCPS